MTAYRPIAWLDPFDVCASLPRRMGLFKGEGGQRHVNLPRFADKLAKWPEMHAMRERLELLGEVERLTLLMLDPGTIMPWATLPAPQARLLMMLRTNPAFAMYAPGEVISPPIGQLLLCNTALPHSAMNLGEIPTIALLIDAKPRGKE